MRFTETPIAGAYVVDLEPMSDERGFFARSFCAREFREKGLNPRVAQSNISYNFARGTLRGMHYQVDPAPETKLVRCSRGAIYDAIFDVRPASPTYCRSYGIELSEENRLALYVPEMCAHGFQTLVDGAEVTYHVGEYYTPGTEKGVRYDDPTLGIEWPLPVSVISPKDASWPDFLP
jgi:dTDP-4-dehydrorhamnose 3,5-epimerase